MSKTNAAVLGLATALALLTAPASAAPHPRTCMMDVGPDQVTFNAFQEQEGHEAFCQDIPGPGPTVITLDAHQNELRAMDIEVRILRDAHQAAWNDDLDANTELLIPRKNYMFDKASMSFLYDFKTNGKYIVVVRALDPDGTKEYVGEYPIVVGPTVDRYVAAGAFLTIATLASFAMWKKNKPTV